MSLVSAVGKHELLGTTERLHEHLYVWLGGAKFTGKM